MNFSFLKQSLELRLCLALAAEKCCYPVTSDLWPDCLTTAHLKSFFFALFPHRQKKVKSWILDQGPRVVSLRPVAEVVAMVTTCPLCFFSFSCCVACREGTGPAGGLRKVKEERCREREREPGLLGDGAHCTSRRIAPAAGVEGINHTE